MKKATQRLYKYQRENFRPETMAERDFDFRAYPETATGIYLDGIARALRVPSRTKFAAGRIESCEELRQRVLFELEKPEEVEEKTNGDL